MFHENIQDDAELLVNAKLLPELSDGGYVEIWKYNKHARDPPHEQRVVLQVSTSRVGAHMLLELLLLLLLLVFVGGVVSFAGRTVSIVSRYPLNRCWPD